MLLTNPEWFQLFWQSDPNEVALLIKNSTIF
jgi:hypothetical protein